MTDGDRTGARTTDHSSKTHSDKLDRESSEDLISEVSSPGLVVEDTEKRRARLALKK